MGRESWILQQRIERMPLDGRLGEPRQRVGGEHHVGDEEHAQRPLHGHREALQARRQALGERDRRAVAGEHEAPQQDRALVAAPGAGDLVEQRLFGVRIGRHVGDREIGGDEGVDQRRERERHASKRAERRSFAGSGQDGAACPARCERHPRLQQR